LIEVLHVYDVIPPHAVTERMYDLTNQVSRARARRDPEAAALKLMRGV
jgi:hypothetical protein